MIADVLTAFVVSLFLEMFSSINKLFKHIVVLAFCIGYVIVYFFNDVRINFIGEIDFSTWVIFVIIFDEMLMLATKRLTNHIKE